MEMLHKFYELLLSYMSYQKVAELVTSGTLKCLILIATAIAVRIIIKVATKSMTKICKRKQIDHHTCHVLNKGIKYSIRALGLIFALQNIGINVSALITALGISGVAISFGMKDTISNIIAGILIMIYKQFKINDHIKIKDCQGTVIDINIRYTTLKTDDATVFIPNSVLYSSTMAIINKAPQEEK